MIRSTKYSLILKTLLLCAAAAVVWLRCGLDGWTAEPFRLFSVCSAALAAIYYVFALIAHTEKGIAVWFPQFRLAALLCVLLVPAVSACLLPEFYDGADAVTRLTVMLTHWVLPIGMVLDWLLFDPHGVLELWDPFAVVVPAVLYGLNLQQHPEASLPYWFLAAQRLGGSTLPVVLGLVSALILAGYVLRGIDWLLTLRRK